MRRSLLARIFAFALLLVGLGVASHCATEEEARRRAERARSSLTVGVECSELVAVAEAYANGDSAQEARRICATPVLGPVTLNFTRGLSLNYFISVALTRGGRVESVSRVEAW